MRVIFAKFKNRQIHITNNQNEIIMRQISVFLTALFTIGLFLNVQAQEQDNGYEFENIIDLPATSVKDQNRSGTCWSFAGLSFLESEMMRKGKDAIDLSEMYIVKKCYMDKARKYVRLHGNLNFSPGGAFHDVTYVMKNYGLVPQSVFPGLSYGTEEHVHGEMDKLLKNHVKGVVKNENNKLSTAWKDSYKGILDAYLGEDPKKFSYNGEEYTPESFAQEAVDLNPNNYVEITSYTHQPFYEQFIIKLPDNWLWGNVYNVKLDELLEIMHYSLEEGYTVAWASDVSEKGFSYKNGVAVVPTEDPQEMSDKQKDKWGDMSKRERLQKLYSFNGPVPEKNITQAMRQKAYDNYNTTDDHGMHITGLAEDQNGKEYFLVKNSWDTTNTYNGYLYASEAFVKYKTMSIMVHKDAIPEDIADKLDME